MMCETKRAKRAKEASLILLTQEEYVYLPLAIDIVCKEVGRRVKAIVVSPPMSTHGGFIKGVKKHFNAFGLYPFFVLSFKTLAFPFLSWLSRVLPGMGVYSVFSVAKKNRIPFFKVKNINSKEFLDLLGGIRPNLLVSISCPQIIKKKIRDKFELGCINVHGALLPKYRGLMPAYWALRNGEEFSGVTVHVLSEKLDDGDILLQNKIKIEKDDTWDSLVRKTKKAGAYALVKVIRMIEEGRLEKRPNREEEATYYSFPGKEDLKALRKMGRKIL